MFSIRCCVNSLHRKELSNRDQYSEEEFAEQCKQLREDLGARGFVMWLELSSHLFAEHVYQIDEAARKEVQNNLHRLRTEYAALQDDDVSS